MARKCFPRVEADYNEHTEPIICPAQAVNTVWPDVAPFIAAQIGFTPVIVFLCPLSIGGSGSLV